MNQHSDKSPHSDEGRRLDSVPPSGVNSFRNRVAHRVCNWVLNHVASPSYRAWVDEAVRRGLRSIVEEYGENPAFKEPLDDIA